jgi:hypothetical protein
MLKKVSFQEGEQSVNKKPIFTYLGAIMLWGLLLLSLCSGLFQRLLVAHADPPPVLSTIFLDTTSPTFTITTVGASGTISYTMIGLSGLLIARGQSAVTNRQSVLTLPRQPDGYYVLQVTDHTAEPSANQTIPFAVITSFAPETDSPFGVGTHFIGGNNPNLAQLISAMGAGMIRDDATWERIERSPSGSTGN